MIFEGSTVRAFAGESVAAALFAGGARVMSRAPRPEDAAGRGGPAELTFEGSTVRASAGASVAAALFASGARVMSRSLKSARPRTFCCLDGHCGGWLVRADGVPNLRACQLP